MKHFLTLGVFIAVAFMAWWSTSGKHSETQQTQQTADQRYLELFMNVFEITAMDASGTPAYILNGKHLEKYSDSGDTEIQQPVLQLLQKDINTKSNGQWKISADNAIVNDEKEIIQLKENVIMQQLNSEPPVFIYTQNLLINTKTQVAQTEDLVEVIQGESHLKSEGMIFNNTSSELELSSNVSGYYLPND